MCALLFGGGGVQIRRRNVKNRLTAAKALFLHTVCRARKGNQNARSKAGVGVKLQFVLHHVFLFAVKTRYACAEYHAAVGNGRL